jgi:hypothetical protein
MNVTILTTSTAQKWEKGKLVLGIRRFQRGGFQLRGEISPSGKRNLVLGCENTPYMARGAGAIERRQHRTGEDSHAHIEPGLRRMRRSVVFPPPPWKDKRPTMPPENLPVPLPVKARKVTPTFATKH